MFAVGLIVGHGYVKVEAASRGAVFPAAAALARAVEFESRVGAGRSVVDLNGHGAWLVGQDALVYAPGQVVSILDRSRYSHPAFLALARAGLQEVGAAGKIRAFTGMPPAWFRDETARGQLADAIKAAAAPLGEAIVTVAPEVAGVFYDYCFEGGTLNQQRKASVVGVLDFGYRDVGVGYFHHGRYIAGDSVPGGSAPALREIKRLIAAEYGLELALHEVDQAVIEGTVRMAGHDYPLPAGTAEALAAGLEPALALGRSMWPNGGAGLDALVLGGGGAEGNAQGVAAAFAMINGRPGPAVDLRESPQEAGVRGFRVMAAAAAAAGA